MAPWKKRAKYLWFVRGGNTEKFVAVVALRGSVETIWGPSGAMSPVRPCWASNAASQACMHVDELWCHLRTSSSSVFVLLHVFVYAGRCEMCCVCERSELCYTPALNCSRFFARQ